MAASARFAKVLWSAAVALMCVAGTSAQASTDFYLKFDSVEGDVTVEGHEKSIAIDSFTWGVTAVAPGDYTFDDFRWMQAIDISTPQLFNLLAAAPGPKKEKAVAEAVAPIEGVGPRTYFRLSFDNVRLSEMHIGGSGGSVPWLSGAFSYGKITMDYWAFSEAGDIAAHESASYDLMRRAGSAGTLALLFARGMAGPEVVSAVPEPGAWAMLLAGLGVTGVVLRRRLRATPAQ